MQTCIMSSLPHCIFRCSVFRYVTLVSFVFLFKLCYLIVTLLLWWRINTYLLTYLHYIVIKSLSRLLSSQNTKRKAKEHFCMNCLQGFKEESSRDEHIGYCKNNESVHIEMPHKNPTVEYSDGQFQFKVPFIIYADLESILALIQAPDNNPTISSLRGVNVHTPSGWCFYSKFAYGKVTNPLKEYREKDCISKFCEHIIAEARCLY